MSDGDTARVAQLIAIATDYKAAAEAIEDEYLLIRRDDLPSVKGSSHDSDTYYVQNENVVYTCAENARMWVMRDIAVWQHIASREARINRRRDELASEFTAVNSFSGQLPYTQNLINRIIELELAQ